MNYRSELSFRVKGLAFVLKNNVVLKYPKLISNLANYPNWNERDLDTITGKFI